MTHAYPPGSLLGSPGPTHRQNGRAADVLVVDGAALGTCTSMTNRMYADRQGWPLERVSVQLRHDRVHAEDCQDQSPCSATTSILRLVGHRTDRWADEEGCRGPRQDAEAGGQRRIAQHQLAVLNGQAITRLHIDALYPLFDLPETLPKRAQVSD
jgi:hypothetical protein